MSAVTISPDDLQRAVKSALKDALAETFAERPGWLRELVAEALEAEAREDAAMLAAIREAEAEGNPVVPREELFAILEGRA